jgi:peptidoglycan/xylan/chitin deacetylase (PgdA/CDA1 family)
MRFVGAVCACLFSAVLAAPVWAQETTPCTASTGIGVARTIDIDTRGGPWFGAPHGNPDLLAPGEVVLTFDDGPLPDTTRPILWALAAECAKATFFVVGEMAATRPELVREMAIQGHTIGTHTWSHANLRALPADAAKAQIEAAFTQVEKAAGQPIAPFFRYPYLSSSHSAVGYLRSRDIAQFSVDIDSLDWRIHNAQSVVRQVMVKLETHGRGIILLHDIHPSTALAIPVLLARLKEKGFKIVHLRPAAPVQTLAVARLPPRSASAAARRRAAEAKDADAKGREGGGWLWKWPFW